MTIDYDPGRLAGAWAHLGVVGTRVDPLWEQRLPCFWHHDDLVCVAYAAGWCAASGFRPVAVVLDGEYVSCDELGCALRQVRHLPLVVCLLGPVAGKLRLDAPLGVVRHMQCVLMGVSSPVVVRGGEEEDTSACLRHVDGVLRASKRPVLVLGEGLTRLSLRAPFPVVVGAPSALRLVATDDPFFIGKCGQWGDRAGNMAVQNADLVVVLGGLALDTRPEWFAREAHVVWVSGTPPPLQGAVHFDCHPDFLVCDHWGRDWSDWVYQCRRWKSRWLLEMPPPPPRSALCVYAFHALLQQHYPDLCRDVVARPDRFLWCPLYQQFLTDDHPRRLWCWRWRVACRTPCVPVWLCFCRRTMPFLMTASRPWSKGVCHS